LIFEIFYLFILVEPFITSVVYWIYFLLMGLKVKLKCLRAPYFSSSPKSWSVA